MLIKNFRKILLCYIADSILLKRLTIVLLICFCYTIKAQTTRKLYSEEDLKGHVKQIIEISYKTIIKKNGKVKTDSLRKEIFSFDKGGMLVSIRKLKPNDQGDDPSSNYYKYIYEQEDSILFAYAFKDGRVISKGKLDKLAHLVSIDYYSGNKTIINTATYSQDENFRLIEYTLFDKKGKAISTENFTYNSDGDIANRERHIISGAYKNSTSHTVYQNLIIDKTGNWTKSLIKIDNGQEIIVERYYVYYQ